jgi:hypothetical protein
MSNKITVRQQYDWWQIEFLFPDRNNTPATVLNQFEGAIEIIKLPRQFPVVKDAIVHHQGQEWRVVSIIASSFLPGQRKGIVPIVQVVVNG